jgi:hypothetical protein
MSEPQTETGNPETLLVVASPQSDWADVAERHRCYRNVLVVFVSSAGNALVSEVRGRVRQLGASGVALAAMSFVGVADTVAIRELVRTVGVPLLG